MIRDIPFRYAPGAITVSIHRITQGKPPAALMTDQFAEDRATFRVLGKDIRQHLDAGEKPDPEVIKKAQAVINAVEAKAEKILPANTPETTEAEKYLKALHGLIGMLDTPALDVILSGVEKHPEATVGELLDVHERVQSSVRAGHHAAPARSLRQHLPQAGGDA